MTTQITDMIKTAPQAVHSKQVAFYYFETNASRVSRTDPHTFFDPGCERQAIVSPSSSQKFKNAFQMLRFVCSLL